MSTRFNKCAVHIWRRPNRHTSQISASLSLRPLVHFTRYKPPLTAVGGDVYNYTTRFIFTVNTYNSGHYHTVITCCEGTANPGNHQTSTSYLVILASFFFTFCGVPSFVRVTASFLRNDVAISSSCLKLLLWYIHYFMIKHTWLAPFLSRDS